MPTGLPVRTRRLSDESGLTLVEVLVTVTIMGVAFVAVLGAFLNGIAYSALHRKMANSQVVMRSFAEHVKAEGFDEVCPATYNDNPTFQPQAPNSGYGAAVTGVEYWVTATASFQGTTCIPGPGLHGITLTVTSPDNGPSETLRILKRAP